MLYITRLKPSYKDYIWGGNRLHTVFGKESGLAVTAESWELSCHPDGPCFVADGKDAGRAFPEVLAEWGSEALGEKAARFGEFPILVKLIDAAQSLSVQVHPDDDYAARYENAKGKTEMWYVLDAEPDATLVYGLKESMTKEDFAAALRNGDIEKTLSYVPVKPGDLFFIPAGMIHAIGKGILLAEIQQNSNLTYRLYDYGRLGADGKPRQLHVEKAMDVSNLEAVEYVRGERTYTAVGDAKKAVLASCPYFTTEEVFLDGKTELRTDGSFRSVLVTRGEGTVGGLAVKAGDTVFIPATEQTAEVCGKMQYLEIYV